MFVTNVRAIAQLSYLYTRIWEALPRSGGDPNVKGDPRDSVKWIDGLRGIASFLVVLTHLSRAWDRALFAPRDTEEASPRLLQLPFFRISWQGRIGVTVFAFLTGYVCVLKPMRLSREGNRLGAFTAVSKSAFRRPPRLIMPATVALIISWTMAQCRAFVTANRSDCSWCRYAAPDLEESFGKEWALLPLLMTSMLVYLLTCATMFMEFRWRMFVYLIMFLYFHQDAAKNTETFQMQGVYGMFLSDLSYEVSFQEFLQKWKWSQDLVILAIYISPSVKGFLSNRLLLWLGAQSFAVYLVQGTLLRTVLCWMLYGITGQPFDPDRKQEGKDEFVWIPIRPPWVVAISIPLWICLVYLCATMWTKYVDAFCAQMTQKLEDRMFFETEKPSTQVESLPLALVPMPTA
ncbi:hypothetical protein BDV12DRAFT_191561 [Aspergillus spectabilis]